LTKKSSKFGSRYKDNGYRMDDLSGNNGPKGFHSEVAISARKGGHPDPSGSESSLVTKDLEGGITKTVGVSVHSYQHSHVQEIQGVDGHSHHV
jgi:hypothetical protein